MSILPIDSCRYGSEEMKEIFKEDMKLQYQLNFEAEVAITQAKLNIIPPARCKGNFCASKIKNDNIEKGQTVGKDKRT